MTLARRSTIQLGLLALTWGPSFLWIALALPMLAASWLTVARLVLGSATLGLYCLAVDPRTRVIFHRTSKASR